MRETRKGQRDFDKSLLSLIKKEGIELSPTAPAKLGRIGVFGIGAVGE